MNLGNTNEGMNDPTSHTWETLMESMTQLKVGFLQVGVKPKYEHSVC